MPPAPSTEIVQRQRDLVQVFDAEAFRQELRELLPAEISEAVFIRGLKNAALANPEILKADIASVYRAVLRSASDRLIPDGVEAAIVVFGGKAQYMAMIAGVRKKLAEFGWYIDARVICENDTYDPDVDAHKANFRAARLGTNRGDIIGAYAIAEHRDGRRIGPLDMDVSEIEYVRQHSKSANSPAWKDWWDRMAEKTVARRLAKELPLAERDRRQIETMFAEMDGDTAVDMLYGSAQPGAAADAPSSAAAPVPAPAEPIPDEADLPPAEPEPTDGGEKVEDGEWEEKNDGDDKSGEPTAQQEFDGDEPTLEEPAQELTATFGSGRCAGKTVQQVWDSGDAGKVYIKWALKNWKTGPIVNDLKTFAEQHKDELA